MSEKEPNENSISEEFRNLGMNLVNAARAAWESPERQKLQGEIEDGLSELGSTLNKEYANWQESPTAQRMKADADELNQRIRSSETENKIREELTSALKTLNSDLQNLTTRWSTSQSDVDQPAASVSESDEEGGER